MPSPPRESIERHPLRDLPRVSRLWFGLAVTSLLLGLSLVFLYRAVDAERVAVSREAESVRLGDQLSAASDRLTDEVRKFVVTADPTHMQSYWYEVETRRTREVVLSRLDALGTPSDELRRLETAKNQSDGLVTTEIRGMRLMLTVMGVPEASMPISVRNYRLLAADAKLPPTEMVAYLRPGTAAGGPRRRAEDARDPRVLVPSRGARA